MATGDYLSPVAYHNIAIATFEHAFALCIAAHAVKMAAIHGGPATLTPEQRAQRTVLVNIQVQLLEADLEKAMDKVVDYWKVYKKMTAET